MSEDKKINNHKPNNVLEFRGSKHTKMKELKVLIKEREEMKQLLLEQEELRQLRKQWAPKLEWTTVLTISIAGAFLVAVTLISIYAAIQ